MCKVQSIQKLVKKLIKNSSKNSSIKNSSKRTSSQNYSKTCQKTCQNIVKKLVKQDTRGKQVPFMSTQSGFQEAPHAPQGGIELKKCSGIKHKTTNVERSSKAVSNQLNKSKAI